MLQALQKLRQLPAINEFIVAYKTSFIVRLFVKLYILKLTLKYIKKLTTPKFSDNNFIINKKYLKNLKYNGLHSSKISLNNIPDACNEMREIYKSNITKPLINRKKQLEQLLKMINENSDKMVDALYRDLGRDEFLGKAGDVTAAKGEVMYMIKNLYKLNKPKRVGMSLTTFPAIDYVISEPYGTVYINGIWNFPFGLMFTPIAGAIAGGNNMIIKPCNAVPECSKLICDLLYKYIDSKFVQVIGHPTIGNDYEITDKILETEFDMIFFTGSSNGGKYIMNKASSTLTPVLLELGGKNPVIIDDDVNISLAARQIMSTRTVNLGQMCISPDYVLCHKNNIDKFINECKKYVNKWFDMNDDNYLTDYHVGKIVNKKQFKRVVDMIKNTKGEIIIGGKYNEDKLKIQPTIIKLSNLEDPSMKQETFGPILWIISINSIKDACNYINTRDKSLSLYMFSNNKYNQNYVVNNTSSGGMEINGCASYITNHKLGFGGVGKSGMGQYHGKKTFNAFVHKKPVVKKLSESQLLYPPRNTNFKLKLLNYL